MRLNKHNLFVMFIVPLVLNFGTPIRVIDGFYKGCIGALMQETGTGYYGAQLDCLSKGEVYHFYEILRSDAFQVQQAEDGK